MSCHLTFADDPLGGLKSRYVLLLSDPPDKGEGEEEVSSSANNDKNFELGIEQLSKDYKGILYRCNPKLQPSAPEEFLQDSFSTSVLVGKYASHVCSYCLRSPKEKKMKRREDCLFLMFCSNNCLDKAGRFIDAFGELLNELYTEPTHRSSSNSEKSQLYLFREYKTSIHYIVQLFYNCYLDRAEFMKLQYIINLYYQKNASKKDRLSAEDDENIDQLFYNMAKYVCAYLANNASFLVEYFCSKLKFPIEVKLVDVILHVSRFNSQQLPVSSKLPLTYYYTIFPFLARLNHSCSPNCQITVDASKDEQINTTLDTNRNANKGNTKNIMVKLIKLREVGNLEELNISYVSTILPVADRIKLLLSNFNFTCKCTRCVQETMMQRIDVNSDPSIASFKRKYGLMSDIVGKLDKIRKSFIDVQSEKGILNIRDTIFQNIADFVYFQQCSLQHLVVLSSLKDSSNEVGTRSNTSDMFFTYFCFEVSQITLVSLFGLEPSRSSFLVPPSHEHYASIKYSCFATSVLYLDYIDCFLSPQVYEYLMTMHKLQATEGSIIRNSPADLGLVLKWISNYKSRIA